jgi:hypothetical protein
LPVRPSRADTAVESQPAVSPKDLPIGSDVTAQAPRTMTVTAVFVGQIPCAESARLERIRRSPWRRSLVWSR